MIQRCISIFIAQREFAVWCERICQYCRLSYNLIIKKMFSVNSMGMTGEKGRNTEYLTYGRHFSVIMWLKSQTHLWNMLHFHFREKKNESPKKYWTFPLAEMNLWKESTSIMDLLTADIHRLTRVPLLSLQVLSGRQSLHHHISLKLAQQAFTMHFLSAWNQNQEI